MLPATNVIAGDIVQQIQLSPPFYMDPYSNDLAPPCVIVLDSAPITLLTTAVFQAWNGGQLGLMLRVGGME